MVDDKEMITESAPEVKAGDAPPPGPFERAYRTKPFVEVTLNFFLSCAFAGAVKTKAFFLSNVAGYRQLALLSNLSIALCLVFSLFVLPMFLRPKGVAEPSTPAPSEITSLRLGMLFRKPCGGRKPTKYVTSSG